MSSILSKKTDNATSRYVAYMKAGKQGTARSYDYYALANTMLVVLQAENMAMDDRVPAGFYRGE